MSNATCVNCRKPLDCGLDSLERREIWGVPKLALSPTVVCSCGTVTRLDMEHPALKGVVCFFSAHDLFEQSGAEKVRIQNCLTSANIHLVHELASKTETQLLRTVNFGKACLAVVKNRLSNVGLELGMPPLRIEIQPRPARVVRLSGSKEADIQETKVDAEPEMVDEQDLERRFNIARATWQDWRYRGKGPPFFRIGKRLIRYRLADVRAWLDSHKEGRR